MLFTSIDKLHTIEITIFGEIAELCITTFHYENYKTFLLLLKKVIEYMANKNIKYVKQRILESDVSLFSYSTIDTYIYDPDNNPDNDPDNDPDNNPDNDHCKTVLITTPIIHIAEEIYNALGLKKV
jgi:hypothetical protein